MKLKIDENLPREGCAILRGSEFEADTLLEEQLAGADDSEVATAVGGVGRVRWIVETDRIRFRTGFR